MEDTIIQNTSKKRILFNTFCGKDLIQKYLIILFVLISYGIGLLTTYYFNEKVDPVLAIPSGLVVGVIGFISWMVFDSYKTRFQNFKQLDLEEQMKTFTNETNLKYHKLKVLRQTFFGRELIVYYIIGITLVICLIIGNVITFTLSGTIKMKFIILNGIMLGILGFFIVVIIGTIIGGLFICIKNRYERLKNEAMIVKIPEAELNINVMNE